MGPMTVYRKSPANGYVWERSEHLPCDRCSVAPGSRSCSVFLKEIPDFPGCLTGFAPCQNACRQQRLLDRRASRTREVRARTTGSLPFRAPTLSVGREGLQRPSIVECCQERGNSGEQKPADDHSPVDDPFGLSLPDFAPEEFGGRDFPCVDCRGGLVPSPGELPA